MTNVRRTSALFLYYQGRESFHRVRHLHEGEPTRPAAHPPPREERPYKELQTAMWSPRARCIFATRLLHLLTAVDFCEGGGHRAGVALRRGGRPCHAMFNINLAHPPRLIRLRGWKQAPATLPTIDHTLFLAPIPPHTIPFLRLFFPFATQCAATALAACYGPIIQHLFRT